MSIQPRTTGMTRMAKPGQVMKKHYKAMMRKNDKLEEFFPAPPMPALRQPKNLRRILCSSKLKPVQRSNRLQRGTHKNAPGWKKCSKPCHICPFTLPDCQEVVGQISGYKHKIKEPLNCPELCLLLEMCETKLSPVPQV